MSDLTFSEISNAGNNCCIVENGKVLIDVSLLTGQPISTLDDAGVFEAIAKLMQAGYAAQDEKNETLATGLKLNAIAEPSSNVPALDGGTIVATTSYSMRLRYSLDLDNPTAPLS